MRKIISYAAAIALMMGLTSGITVNAADEYAAGILQNRVEAETAVINAKTENKNNKIEKRTNDLVYFVRAGYDAPAAVFKLKEVKKGDIVDVDINCANAGNAAIEYGLFTSDTPLTIDSIAADKVKIAISKELKEYTIYQFSNNNTYDSYSLINDYIADDDGYLYLYIGANKDNSGNELVEGKLESNKFQINIDYFDVNITPAQTVPSDDSEYRTCDGVMESDVLDEKGAPYWTFTKTMDGTSVNAVNVEFKSGDDERIVKCELGTYITGDGSVEFSIFVTDADDTENLQAKMIE